MDWHHIRKQKEKFNSPTGHVFNYHAKKQSITPAQDFINTMLNTVGTYKKPKVIN